MSSVRILNVVPTLMCGGTENQFMTLSRELDPTRFELEFACLRRWGGFIKEIHDRAVAQTVDHVAQGAADDQPRCPGNPF